MLRCFLILWAFALTALADSPKLRYSTIAGDDFDPVGIAADRSGNVYLAGSGTPGATGQRTFIVLTAIRPDGAEIYTRRIAVTGTITVGALAVDGAGYALLAGGTTAPDLQPDVRTQLGAAPSGSSDGRSFLMKLDPQGAVVWSTYLGGTAVSSATGVALTSDGKILVSGTPTRKAVRTCWRWTHWEAA